MRNVIEFTHRASGARDYGLLASPSARARRAHEILRKPTAFCRMTNLARPAGLLMSLTAPTLLSLGSA
jgi:hypothetical protein